MEILETPEVKTQSMTLQEVVMKLQAEQLEKRDLVVPSNKITMMDDQVLVEVGEISTSDESNAVADTKHLFLRPLKHAHAQLSEKLGINKNYYDKMLGSAPGLLAINANFWLNQSTKSYLLRTFVGKDGEPGILRAFLSDSFKVIDNLDVLMCTLEAIKESGIKMEIQQCDISDTKMYVRFIAPEIYQEAEDLLENYRVPGSKGRNEDFKIFSGLVITNSEVGNGSYTISPYGIVSVCSNGMVWRGDAMKKIHLGTRMDESTSVKWSEETKQKNMELVLSQTKDAVRLFMSPEYLGEKINKLREEANIPLQHPFEAVKNVCKELSYSQEKQDSIMNYFVQGGNQSRFGIVQAITYYAGQTEDADEKYDTQIDATEIIDKIGDLDKPAKKKE
jgi:hypothetical protein